MLDTKYTQQLAKLYQQLHVLNTQYKSLEIEESVFVVDEDKMKERKHIVLQDILDVLSEIDMATKGVLKWTTVI